MFGFGLFVLMMTTSVVIPQKNTLRRSNRQQRQAHLLRTIDNAIPATTPSATTQPATTPSATITTTNEKKRRDLHKTCRKIKNDKRDFKILVNKSSYFSEELEDNNTDIVFKEQEETQYYGNKLGCNEEFKYVFDSSITTGRVHPDNDCLNCIAYSPYPPNHKDFGCMNCRRDASKCPEILYFLALDSQFF